MQYVGIYNADGTVLGEIAYVFAKYTGRRHCELCDITHGTVRRKPSWDDACSRAGVCASVRNPCARSRATIDLTMKFSLTCLACPVTMFVSLLGVMLPNAAHAQGQSPSTKSGYPVRPVRHASKGTVPAPENGSTTRSPGSENASTR